MPTANGRMRTEADLAGAARAAARGVGMLCLLAGLAGCSETAQIQVNQQVEQLKQPAQWVVVVFPLEDSSAKETNPEYAVYGRPGAQGSGAMVARAISRAVGASGRFRSVDDTALRNLMLDEKLTAAEFAAVDDRRAGELGRKLGANLVVRGQVAVFERTWLLFMPKTTVRVELRGLDPPTGAMIWSAVISVSSTSRSEASLIAGIADDALRAIAEGVGAPQ